MSDADDVLGGRAPMTVAAAIALARECIRRRPSWFDEPEGWAEVRGGQPHAEAIEAVLSALQTAQEDSRRLDWLEQQGEVYGEVTDYDCTHKWRWGASSAKVPLRAAIDAVRAPQGGAQP